MSLDAYVAELGALPPLLTVVGLGDGELLAALDRAGFEGRLVAFEPRADEVLERSARYGAWIQAGRLRMVRGPAYSGAIDTCLAFWDDGFKPLVVPTFGNQFPDETREALHAMSNAIRAVRANAESRQRLSATYRRNTLLNARLLAQESDVTCLDNLAAGIPAIIVAAGPSLDSDLDALRDAQHRAVVIAVDTAVRPLLAAGITPHFAVAVDATPTNATHLLDVSRAASTWLIAEGSLDPHALAAFRGRIFGCRVGRHDPWPMLEQHGLRLATVRAWGSVITTAADIAMRLGATTIAMVGADMAFTEGRPYCRGTSYELTWRRVQDWGTPIDSQWQAAIDSWPHTSAADHAGNTVRTAPHLIAFRDWFIEQAASRPSLRIINASSGGILVGDGIEHASLATLSVTWPRVDLRPLIAARHMPIDPHPHLPLLPVVDTSDQCIVAPPVAPPPQTTWRQADPVTMALVRMRIPRSRIHPRADGSFTFTFRTRAARRWIAQRYVGEPRVYYGDRELPDVEIALDEVVFKTPASVNPRFDGESIYVEVPEDIANYEALPLDLVLERGL